MGRGGGVTPHAVPVAVSEGGSSAEGLALQFWLLLCGCQRKPRCCRVLMGNAGTLLGIGDPARLVGWEPRLAAELVSVPLHSQAGDPRTACTDPLGARRDSYC